MSVRGVGDCSPRFTAQGDESDGDGTCCYCSEAPCRYVSDTLRPFFFSFSFFLFPFLFFSWTWWWVPFPSQSLFNSGLTVPMKRSLRHHTDHYFSSLRSLISYSSMPFSPITLFTLLVLFILMLFCFLLAAVLNF